MGWRIGYDVGGTHARISAFDASWQAQHTARVTIRQDTTPQAVCAALVRLLKELHLSGEVVAVGVGLAAQMERGGRVVLNAPNLGWRDLDFGGLLSEALGQEALLVNDLNAMLWGEHLEGAAQDHDDVLAVYVGTGVGGAMLSGGRLVEGAGVAGEIGHVKVSPGGDLCGCGQRGCLEAYVGGVHLERRMTRLAHTDPALTEAILDHEGAIDLARADAAADHHEAVMQAWDEAASLLALSVANACTLLNPSLLLLGGGVWMNCPSFRELTLTRLPPLVLDAAHAHLDVKAGALGDLGGMLGAAHLATARLTHQETSS